MRAQYTSWTAALICLAAAMPLKADVKPNITDYFSMYYAQHGADSGSLEFLRNAAASHIGANRLLEPAPSRTVIIDRRNGFVQIYDGSGTDQTLTIALYRKADGSSLILVGSSDCADGCDFAVQLFVPGPNGLIPVPARQVLPRVGAARFIKPGHAMPKAISGIDPMINYVPARAGTALTLKPWYGYETEEQMTAATRAAIRDVILKWDRARGVFVVPAAR